MTNWTTEDLKQLLDDCEASGEETCAGYGVELEDYCNPCLLRLAVERIEELEAEREQELRRLRDS